MKRIHVAGVCIAVVLACGGVATAQASAKQFVWKVNGATLGAGARAFVARALGAQVLTTTFLGVKYEVSCAGVRAIKGEIIGGRPGTSAETFEYSKCTVTKPAGCKIPGEKITTKPLKDEIVEGVGASGGKLLLLFAPAVGEVFAEPRLEGGFLCLALTIEGSVLAEVIPMEREEPVLKLKFEPAEGTSYKNAKGEVKVAGLTVKGGAAHLLGEVDIELNPVEKFGVF